MEKNNVVPLYKTASPNSPSLVMCSPGNNPFDTLLKKTLDTTTKSEWNTRRSSFHRMSSSFHELNTSDFGRESIGILPPDFGRDSLGFMNLSSSEIGRESLGILPFNVLRESLSFRRESIGLLNLTDLGRESLDCGRESLGILHLKSPDVKFGDEDKKIPEIILSTIEENSDFICNPLNTAFLNSYSRKSSGSSTISSITPSFNSCSLEGPSMIDSLSLRKTDDDDKSNLLNKAFIDGDQYSLYSTHSPLSKSKLTCTELFSVRSRIQSLPVSLEKNCEPLNSVTEFGCTDRKFWTTDRTIKSKTLQRRSFHGTLDFEDTSDDFHDSVFIEGEHIAEKIGDGSILNDLSGEIGILDCTPQPNWPEDLSLTDKEKEIKPDTETVFKTVDKMLPPPSRDIKFKLKTSKADSNSSNEDKDEKSNISCSSKSSHGSGKDGSKLLQNISNITHDSDKHSVSRKSQSMSKDAKELLHNLSEILNCTQRTDQQKSEGQNLLSSLADMLCENHSNIKSDDPDDSGHSSINEHSESPKKENHECFDVLDLRAKSTREHISGDESTNNKDPLDLSMKKKSKEDISDQCLTQSYSSQKTIPLVIMKNNSMSFGLNGDKSRSKSLNSTANSNDSKNISNASRSSIAGKLRPKSVSHNTKKGPIKAIIPLGDMKKRNSLAVTPERSQQNSSPIQSKRTSTPINEPKLRPMAASTPAGRPEKDRKENINSSHQKSKKIDSSPTVRRDRLSTPSSSLPKALNMDSKLFRRNSVSEVKKTEAVGNIKRSNSIEGESGVMSSLAKVRQNIINSPYYQLKKQSTLRERNVETENKVKSSRSKGLPIGKTANSISKLKTTGKENIGK